IDVYVLKGYHEYADGKYSQIFEANLFPSDVFSEQCQSDAHKTPQPRSAKAYAATVSRRKIKFSLSL
ncbi:MAG: hypothetical protein IKK69_00130, partial [Firmicutes bacterium]|nr:hypothetical protein [Bacillota bacterium]